MPKIYDCFIFNGEDAILELRLNTLNHIVSRFVIVEATRTHVGQLKSLFFNFERFREFADKITYILVDDMPFTGGGAEQAWANEHHQRNCIMRGLADAAPEDLIIVSDADEIPNPDAVLRYRPIFLYGTLIQRWYCYYLNNQNIHPKNSKPRDWIRPKITTLKHLNNFFGTPQNLRIRSRESGMKGALKRSYRHLLEQRIRDGGWHFSWVMTVEQMITKMSNYLHAEDTRTELKDVDAIKSAIRECRDILGKGEKFRLVPLDDSFPPYLLKNPDRFRDWYLDPLERK